MTSRPTLFRLILALLLVAFCSAPCLAWWPIAHYVIAKNAGYTDLAPYAQLPDYVDSYRISLNPLEWGGFLNDQFLWGHALQSHGSVEWVPLQPTYPDDGRYPEQIMWNLVQKKLKGLTAADKTEMERVAKGWLIHNAADRLVHLGVPVT